ncbi:MAG: hypothetical protein UY04_C0062G0009 [Parcubacteria group bacterium GW2011_GWA2_47_7]|nr:MAG: hypothetical protein UY04_C0062G0009 [Parcubacteria group bacterium GW2011_GWA2_47_7]
MLAIEVGFRSTVHRLVAQDDEPNQLHRADETSRLEAQYQHRALKEFFEQLCQNKCQCS